jgi:hypothetical protein
VTSTSSPTQDRVTHPPEPLNTSISNEYPSDIITAENSIVSDPDRKRGPDGDQEEFVESPSLTDSSSTRRKYRKRLSSHLRSSEIVSDTNHHRYDQVGDGHELNNDTSDVFKDFTSPNPDLFHPPDHSRRTVKKSQRSRKRRILSEEIVSDMSSPENDASSSSPPPPPDTESSFA